MGSPARLLTLLLIAGITKKVKQSRGFKAMEVLKVSQFDRFQSGVLEWCPGMWERLKADAEMIKFAVDGGLGEMEPHFRVCENSEGKISMFVLKDFEEIQSLGGHEARRSWFHDNLEFHPVGRRFAGAFYVGHTLAEARSRRQHNPE